MEADASKSSRGRAALAEIQYGRFCADLSGPCVLFLIGMRINRLRSFGCWFPVAGAMGPMIAEVAADKASGFLTARTWIGWRNILVQQYWRSTDDLLRYAQDSAQRHRPAWTEFYRQVGIADGAAVGIWHETVVLEAGKVETVYGNMPPFGLGEAVGTVPAIGRRETAASRLAQTAISD
jgi:hypothetical protein